MKATVIRIGNSRGIRLPKTVLEHVGIEDQVELEVEDDRVVIRPARPPRSGWAEAFAEMARAGDDRILDDQVSSGWDRDE